MVVKQKNTDTGCSVIGCCFKSPKLCQIQKIRLFPFPVRENPVQAMLWCQILKKEKPLRSSQICELHFIGGKPDSLKNSDDYYPSIFAADSVINRKLLESLPGMSRKRSKIRQKKTELDSNYSSSEKIIDSKVNTIVEFQIFLKVNVRLLEVKGTFLYQKEDFM